MMNDFDQVIGTVPGMDFTDPFSGTTKTPDDYKSDASRLRVAGIQYIIIGGVMLLTAAALTATAINLESGKPPKKNIFWR